MKKPEDYVAIIIRDFREKIASETPTIYETNRLERVYEFFDGAVVKYEWQDEATSASGNPFNHRFTLIKLPSPNEHNLVEGIIKTINYPK